MHCAYVCGPVMYNDLLSLMKAVWREEKVVGDEGMQ